MLNLTKSTSIFKSKKKTETRQATAARFIPNLLMTLWISLSMIFGGVVFFSHQVSSIKHQYNPEQDPMGFITMLSVFLAVNLVMGVTMTIGMGKFTKTEWDLEWLTTLPISKPVLLINRLIERAILNPLYLGVIYLPIVLIFKNAHYSIAESLVYGVWTAIPLLFFASAIQTIIDTGLRLKMKPARLKNLQAMASLLSIALLILPQLSAGHFPPHLEYLKNIFGSITLILPFGLIPKMIYSTFPELQDVVLTVVETLVLIGGPYLLLLYQLRDGVVAGSGELSTRSKFIPKIAPSFLSPFMLREIRLLIRDQGYLAQTILTPLMVLGLQIFAVMSEKKIFLAEPKTVASMAFGMAGYSMMFSCFMCVVAEGASLWILYTLPRTLKSILFEKSFKWGVMALLYLLGFFTWAAFQMPHLFEAKSLIPFVLAFIGVPIFAVVTTSLGVLGFEGPSATFQKKMKPSSSYIYMLMMASYIGGFYLPSYFQTFISCFLIAMVAFALWQKAEERLPFLLDPAGMPRPTVSFGDGLIAAQLFLVLQSLLNMFMTDEGASTSGISIFKSFFFSGTLIWITIRIFYWKSETQDIPVFKSQKPFSSLAWGLGAGITGAAIAFGYMAVIKSHGWFSEELKTQLVDRDHLKLWVGVCAVLGAPIFEEFIFRGLIYRGLRRSIHPAFAVLISSLVFAFVHPTMSIIPVAILGVLTAIVFEVTGSLMGPMITHAVYNFSVFVLFPLLST